MNAPLQRSGGPTALPGGYNAPEDQTFLELDLVKLFRTLRRRLNVIISVVVVVTALVMVAVFQLTPLYTASTQVMIDTQRKDVVNLDAVMAGLSSDSAAIDTEVEIIKSRTIARRVVEKLSLVNDPDFNPEMRSATFLETVDPTRWIRSFFSSEGEPQAPDTAERQLNTATDILMANEDVRRRGLVKK